MRLTLLLAAGAAALALVPASGADAGGVKRPPTSYPGGYVVAESRFGNGTVSGLLARPAGADGPLPAVLVIHENRGLNPYIEDVVRRLAKAGYLALGPDGLTSLGGYPGTDEAGREMQSGLDPAKLMEDFFASYRYLDAHPDATGRVLAAF